MVINVTYFCHQNIVTFTTALINIYDCIRITKPCYFYHSTGSWQASYSERSSNKFYSNGKEKMWSEQKRWGETNSTCERPPVPPQPPAKTPHRQDTGSGGTSGSASQQWWHKGQWKLRRTTSQNETAIKWLSVLQIEGKGRQ